jgi:hypothetical protein
MFASFQGGLMLPSGATLAQLLFRRRVSFTQKALSIREFPKEAEETVNR